MPCDTVSGAAAAAGADEDCSTARGSGRVVAGEPDALVRARLGGTRATARPVMTAATRRRRRTTGTGSPVGGGGGAGVVGHRPAWDGGSTSVPERQCRRGQSLVWPSSGVRQDSALRAPRQPPPETVVPGPREGS